MGPKNIQSHTPESKQHIEVQSQGGPLRGGGGGGAQGQDRHRERGGS